VAAESGKEALATLEQQTFDLALVDVHMPEMSGFDLAAAIRQRWPDLPMKMAVLTSMRHRGDAELCLQLKIGAYVSKPVKNSDLFKMMQKLMALPGVESVPEKGASPAAASRALRILLAEDNLVNQKVAGGMLQRLGHTTTFVKNGLEALEQVHNQTFDLILMDVQMPEMDGLEAARNIRAWEGGKSHLPIIALTAHAMDSHREECLQAGMDSFITKPIQLEALRTEIDRMCGVAAGALSK
jgi:two-component system sensor histidine kinase/response regulator